MSRIQVLLIHLNRLSLSFHLSSSLLPCRWQREKENMQKVPKRGEIAHVYNRMHAWLIARLSNTDCDDRWSDRLRLILSPWMRSLVLQHPSMHFRCDERAMPPHGVGWAACPWVGAENSPDTDIVLKWWSFLLSWRDGTPTSFPLFLSCFLICVIPIRSLHWFFYKWQHHVSSQSIFPASLRSSHFLDC